jgi:hypothetical protein
MSYQRQVQELNSREYDLVDRLDAMRIGREADTRIKCLEALLARREMQAAELQLENAELRKDAERYRFLRDEAYEAVIPHGGKLNGSRTAWIPKMHPGPSFDAAIDAAITGAAK